MAKPCKSCNGKGTIKTTETERVWDPSKKKIRIVVKEVTKTCSVCKGWGQV